MAYPYTTLERIKSRLNISDSNDDASLQWAVDGTNAYIESITERAIGSNTVTQQLIDGWDCLDERTLIYKDGVRSITTLEVKPYTGGDWVTVPATDYFVRPSEHLRVPGWPGFEIQMTDIPSSGNTYPFFPSGYETIRLTAAVGWAEMPTELREVADVIAVRVWQARQFGQQDMGGTDDAGVVTFTRATSARDMRTIMRFKWRPVWATD